MKTFRGTVEDFDNFIEDIKCEIPNPKNDLYTTDYETKAWHSGYFFEILSESSEPYSKGIEIWISEDAHWITDDTEIEYGIYYYNEKYEKFLKKWL